MKKVIRFTFGSLLCLSACGTPYAQNGYLKFNVQWPQTAAFQIQVIPADVTHIDIEIFDETGKRELLTSVPRGQGAQQVRLTLRVGNKKVKILAKDAQERVLAESEETVTIKVGEVSQVQSELLPVELIADSGSAPGGSGNPSSDGQSSNQPAENPGEGPSEPLEDPDTQTPAPEQSTAPEPTPQPTATPSSSGGGGGGGGASTANPSLSLMATPSTLPGMGYAAFVETLLSDNSTPASVSWSCTPPTGATQCGSFSGNTAKTVWTAPADSSEFGDETVKTVSFTLTGTATLENGTTLTASVVVNVKRGTSSSIDIPNPNNQGQ